MKVDVFVLEAIDAAHRGERKCVRLDISMDEGRAKLMRLIQKSIAAGDDVEICGVPEAQKV